MRKRTCLVWLLAICLTLALQTAVFAETGNEFTVSLIDVYMGDLTGKAPALFSEPLSWNTNAKNYRDQLAYYCEEKLDGNTVPLTIYDTLKTVFEQDHSGAVRLSTDTVEFSNGTKTCWITPILMKKTWNVSEIGFENMQAILNNWFSEMDSFSRLASAAFVADHPEYFWINVAGGPSLHIVEREGSQTYIGTDGKVYLDTTLCYNYAVVKGYETLERRVTRQAQVDQTVAALLNKTKGLTNTQKVAYWDNWLANQNNYNETAAYTAGYHDSVDASPWTVASSLVAEKEPVCEGYAKALQLLCHEAGIPCVQQSGLANGGAHMWAAVKLDDQWYFCDPTWDDPAYTGDGADMDYSTRFYLLTSQPESHTANDYYGLGTPSICGESVFPRVKVPYYETDYESVVPSEWLMDKQDGVCGLEIGSNTMVIALYGEGGKFLGVGTCEAMKWSASEYIYLAPAFDRDLLEQAVTARRLNITDALTWTPVTAALPIE